MIIHVAPCPDQSIANHGYAYIYSPINQDVEVGLWWGEFYLNGGKQLRGKGENLDLPMRNPRLLKLKKELILNLQQEIDRSIDKFLD